MACDTPATDKEKGIATSEILASHPAFASDSDLFSDNAAISGLQALKYESEDPNANALSYKEEGNYYYQKKEFSKAVDSYTGGIRAKPTDMQLLAVLYTNRAISQSCLKNFGSCIRDCKAAIASYPSHLKAYSKGAKAALALSKTEQALEFCEHGLSLFPNCDDLMQIQMNALRLQVELDRKAAAKAKVEKRDAEKQLATFQLALKHGVRINFKLPPIDVPDAAGVLFYADASDRLHWSVLFMYPEFGETDFLRDCVESSSLLSVFCVANDGKLTIRIAASGRIVGSVLDCLKLVFNPEQPAPSWDPQRKYTCKDESLEVYFEDTVDEQKMISFPVITTLKQLTRRKDFSLRRDLLIIIHVISKNSAKFYERWKTRLDEF